MEHLSSVKNSCRLLKFFLQSPSKELGVSDLSRKLSLSKGAVHKMLATLESEGFIRQNPATKQYCLGYTLLELGNQVLKDHNLSEFVKPYLQNLAAMSHELITLCVKDDRDAIYVEKIDSQYPIRFNVDMYRRFPLYATSAARVIFAHCDSALIDELLDEEIHTFTPYSFIDPEAIKTRLREIKQQGYEMSSNMRNVGVTGIAAPLFNANGEVTASISIIGPSDRMLPLKDKLIEQIVGVTREISSKLGYHAN
ncbi:IclR family transcriptional regulator [Paenibacillus sp. FSL H7-0331]|uniref:IclR family transcriptional regulator n=1 Tax=Paenibacillus sp. FSL H7-0331 TaxID=1920421 RepID=UPI00096F610D|nr:IclR family transcriptional regulator [Paenibacillus sp. FSL H7-0331]OMF12299.1 transcriptional regulator [Paenibacillus sp. FSL H7-0331]